MNDVDRMRWHRDFLLALGHRNGTRMNDRDFDSMRVMRAGGVTPADAAVIIRIALRRRHGSAIK